MRIFIDCEFNGFAGKLISMALVADDGEEWYGLMPPLSTYEPWVLENVIPHLHDLEPHTVAVSGSEFREEMRRFLSQYDNPTIISDWYTDLVHFFLQFQGRDHSESFHYQCKAELRTDIAEIHPQFPHNALSDAHAIRAAVMVLDD